MVSKGKTWARNLLLIFFIWGTFWSLYSLPAIKVEFRLQVIITAIGYSLGLILTILLYLKPSKQWFENFKQQKS
jgi:hypothetical protein